MRPSATLNRRTRRQSSKNQWKRRRLLCESLENRFVLTTLASFVDFDPNATVVPPTSGTANSGAEVSLPVAVGLAAGEADLVFLANQVSDAERAALEQVEGPLWGLYSQSLQGTFDGTTSAQFINTPWDHSFLSRDEQPVIDVHVEDVDLARPTLERLGVSIYAEADTDSWQILTGNVDPSAIGQIAMETPGLISVRPAERGYSDHDRRGDINEGDLLDEPIERSAPDPVEQFQEALNQILMQPTTQGTQVDGLPAESIGDSSPGGGSGDAQGGTVNEWEALTKADQLKRIKTFIDGQTPFDNRIEIGVMSDTIDFVGGGISDSVASGDLPPGSRVSILDDASSGVDEGRAMAELVYDLGEEYIILYHTAAQGATDFANGIFELGNASNVITDDFSYYSEPVFQDGVIAQSVNNTYNTYGSLIFGSAGNRNNETYYGTWDSPDGDNFHDFVSGDETINVTLANGETLNPLLHWNQPWGGATTDIDIQVWDASLTTKLADSNSNNIGGNPIESLSFTNTTGSTATFNLVFDREGGASAAGLQLYMVSRGNSDDFQQYTTNQRAGVSGNHASTRIFAMGAVNWQTPNTIESFSSRGPNTIYFNTSGNPITPVDRLQPSFTAADGVSTSVPGFGTFFGTSAASPNAAASTGLILDAADRQLTYTELTNLYADTADGTGTGSWDGTHGRGRINTLGAGMVAAGINSSETVVELNQFGDAVLSGSVFQSIGSNTDIDTLFFAFDNSGTAQIDVTEPSVDFDAAAILWNQETDDFVEIDYDTSGDDPQFNRSLSLWTLYQVDVFAEEDLTGAPSDAGDFTFSIDGPAPTITTVTLNSSGDFTSTSGNLGNQDADYYNFVAPANASSLLDIVVTPVAGLDAVVNLFDSAGMQVARADSGGAGGTETIRFNNVIPAESYSVRVGSREYATTGDFSISINVSQDTFLVTSTSDSGVGSLRWALDRANAHPNVSGADRIEFAFGGSGPFRFTPATQLPPVNDPVRILGSTQPGYSGTPLIELDGSLLSGNIDGLRFNAVSQPSFVNALAVFNFPSDGIQYSGDGFELYTSYLGLDASGNAAPNANNGLRVQGGMNAVIGSNTISGNAKGGILVNGSTAVGNQFTNNRIGTSPNGSDARPNGIHGVQVSNGSDNLFLANTISGNTRSGVRIVGPTASNNFFRENYVGLNVAGNPLPNLQYGFIVQAPGNFIGGAGQGNTISSNGLSGVFLLGSRANGTVIIGNGIGVSPSGMLPRPNGGNGVRVQNAADVRIGGTGAGAGNTISGNNQTGVYFAGNNAKDARLLNNLIGTTSDGTAALGNGGHGIFFDNGSRNAQVGGNTSVARNVISDNAFNGILVNDNSFGHRFIGNFIGTDAAGTSLLPNDASGVFLRGYNNIVGGTGANAGNVLAGGTRGVTVFGSAASNNSILNNYIGTDLGGTLDFGASQRGVLFVSGASDNLVEGNTIRNNFVGVRVENGSTNNRITRNSIAQNDTLGIDLVPNAGNTGNDGGDGDEGGNRLQNFPELQGDPVRSGNNLIVTYRVRSATGNASYPLTIEFFASDLQREGETFLASNVYSSADFAAGFKTVTLVNAGLGLSPGISKVVATATDAAGNTSEFSGDRFVVSSLAAPLPDFNVATDESNRKTLERNDVSQPVAPMGAADLTKPLQANLPTEKNDFAGIRVEPLDRDSSTMSGSSDGELESNWQAIAEWDALKF